MVTTGFAFGENLFLDRFRQSNIAMGGAVDVHEHSSPDEKGVFVDAGLLTLGDAWERENSMAQFLVELVSGLMTGQCLHGAG